MCEAPGRTYVTPDADRPPRVLLVAWVNRNHFEPILAAAAATNAGPGEPAADGYRGVFALDAPVVRRLLG